MPSIQPPPGIFGDRTRIHVDPIWTHGLNIRWRGSEMETLGFIREVRDVNEVQLVLPETPAADPVGTDVYRSNFISPSSVDGLKGGQVLFGSARAIQVMYFDVNSQPTPGTRWLLAPITPLNYYTVPDVVTVPASGELFVAPTVHWAGQDTLIAFIKANDMGNPPFIWERDINQPATKVTMVGDDRDAPKGAVGIATVSAGDGRIMLLLGAQSVGETGQPEIAADEFGIHPAYYALAPVANPVGRYLCVRWSHYQPLVEPYDLWNQTPDTVAGEMYLDNGSRIMGGGKCRFGVAVWTDESLWMLSYVADPDVVFFPKNIDGSSGLLSNRAWCETEGRLWWWDNNRRLMTYDGGSPRAIPNPNKLTTVERLTDYQIQRAYMYSNPEFDEVILAYPQDDEQNPDTELVFNYSLNAWYPWKFPRTAWHRRVGGIDAIAVDHEGRLFFHDTDTGIGDPYLAPPSYVPPVVAALGLPTLQDNVPDAADVVPQDFAVFTNPVSTSEVTSSSLRQTRLHFDMIHSSALNLAEPDTVDFHCVGYGISQVANSTTTIDVVTNEVGDLAADVRVAGKAIQLGLTGNGLKTMLRLGPMTFNAAGGGAR